MEAEMREQPICLTRNAGRYLEILAQALHKDKFELVLLAARGSSDHAALYARYLIEIQLGIPVVLAAPSVLTRYHSHVHYPKNTLAIGISQSGSAPDVSEVLATLRSAGHTTIAITNTSGSSVTQAAEHSLLLEAGLEKSVAATKTYTCSLLAVYCLVLALGGTLPSPDLPDEAWIESTRMAAEESAGVLLRNSILFSLARGYRFCSAQESALKLMECALLPCKAYSSADFSHGPMALSGPGTGIVSFGIDDEGLLESGAEVVRTPESSVPEEIKPIWDVFFGQWLALVTARARGLDPDHPRGLRKITKTL